MLPKTLKTVFHAVLIAGFTFGFFSGCEMNTEYASNQGKRVESNTADRIGVTRQNPPFRSKLSPADIRYYGAMRLNAVLDEKHRSKWLKGIQKRKFDKSYIGVIGSVYTPDGNQVTIERRNVLTEKGLLPLLLTRIGDDFVYDGDIIVPPSSIAGVGLPPITELPGNMTFAAGIPGVFGSGALWDDGIIPFEVADDFCCTDALNEAIEDFHERTIFQIIPRDGHETYVRFVNAFLTTSRTTLGKQQGENTVYIKEGSSMGNIQHEIGHELNLVHEHLRSDRDQHIARNPNCSPADIFQSIYEGWIDITNVAFTNDAAELLTEYDFKSLMHYTFLLDTDPNDDENPLCSTWVRIETCPDGDPASPDCEANFSYHELTDKDIEGLHKIYSMLPRANEFLENPDEVQAFTGDNIRHRGKRIDRCLHGQPFGTDGCNNESRDRVADQFCQTQGFTNGFNVQYESMWGTHSGFHAVEGWKDVWGADVIASITCENLTETASEVNAGNLVEATFRGNEVSIGGRQIDRCVWGDNIAGDRCSESNQRRVADEFCEIMEFDESSAFETAWGLNLFMTGFHPDTDDFRDVAGSDFFTEISCVR